MVWGSFQVNSHLDWSKVVNVCWSLSPALPWKHTIPKYNQRTEARPWGRWWFSSSISAFSVDKATATTIQLVFAALLSLHIHVQCAQAMAMNTAVTGPFWFYNGWKNGRILLKITWTDQIATPKDAIGVLLVGGESCHPASPTPFVQCWSNLWVEKFVGFNGREDDKNGASKAFISKLKINSWAWAAWTNRQIPCLVPVSLCQFKHLHHCTKKL